MQERLTRSQVPVERTWNLDYIFATEEEWERELASVQADIGSVTKYKGRLGESAKLFLECLEAAEAIRTRFRRVMSYASMKLSADGTDPANQVNAGRAGAVAARLGAETSFINSEALALPEGTLQRYLDQEPGLEPFRRTVETLIRNKPHQLSPETEKTLASLREVLDAPAMIYRRSRTSDMTFDPIVDGKGNRLPMSFPLYEDSYERSADPVLRRNAYASFTKGLRAYQNTYGAAWGTDVKRHVIEAKLRGFPSATHMVLHGQEVPLEVYNNIHDVILKELAPHMRKYAQLRKKVLGLDKLLYCDIEAPLDPDFGPKTTFEEGAKIILDGISVLGPEYAAIIKEGLENRWIDLAENIGKDSGAYCNPVPGVHPYVFITWADNMRSVLMLSHELGHAGHGVLSLKYQRPSNSLSGSFFVEAPSTINELLVGNKVLSKTTDQRMRRWIIMQFLTTYHHNFVRHLIEGELQRRTWAMAEKGQPITASLLNKVQGEILDEFWGGEVEIDEGARLTWMRQHHYYMTLYSYTYSAGLTVGTAVTKAILKEGQPVVDRWLNVLKAGSTKPPLELAKMAGVDMTNPDTIREAVAYVGELVDEVVRSY